MDEALNTCPNFSSIKSLPALLTPPFLPLFQSFVVFFFEGSPKETSGSGGIYARTKSYGQYPGGNKVIWKFVNVYSVWFNKAQYNARCQKNSEIDDWENQENANEEIEPGKHEKDDKSIDHDETKNIIIIRDGF